MKQIKNFLLIILSFIISSGCADKFDITQFNKYSDDVNISGDTLYIYFDDVNISGDTLYIQTGQPWGGFNNPQAILIGIEPFIYVCDTDNNRIVMINIAGEIQGSLSIKRPVAISQDYKLNLIVCAEFDTSNVTYSAVYKIDLH